MERIAYIISMACLLLATVARVTVADPVQWATNGHWYEAVVSSTFRWEEGGQAAQGMSWMGMPGHLATITSLEEGDFIASWIPNGGFWLAGYQDPASSPVSQDWHWQTAEPWVYTHWATNEPNDYYGAGSEACLELYAPNSGWNDVRCGEFHFILVEYDGITPVAPTTWGAIKALFGSSSK